MPVARGHIITHDRLVALARTANQSPIGKPASGKYEFDPEGGWKETLESIRVGASAHFDNRTKATAGLVSGPWTFTQSAFNTFAIYVQLENAFPAARPQFADVYFISPDPAATLQGVFSFSGPTGANLFKQFFGEVGVTSNSYPMRLHYDDDTPRVMQISGRGILPVPKWDPALWTDVGPTLLSGEVVPNIDELSPTSATRITELFTDYHITFDGEFSGREFDLALQQSARNIASGSVLIRYSGVVSFSYTNPLQLRYDVTAPIGEYGGIHNTSKLYIYGPFPVLSMRPGYTGANHSFHVSVTSKSPGVFRALSRAVSEVNFDEDRSLAPDAQSPIHADEDGRSSRSLIYGIPRLPWRADWQDPATYKPLTAGSLIHQVTVRRAPLLNSAGKREPPANKRITGVVVTARGSGYDAANPPAVTLVSSGAGDLATARAIIKDGEVVAIYVQAGGDDYTAAVKVEIDPPPDGGTQAQAKVIYGLNSFTFEIGCIRNGEFTRFGELRTMPTGAASVTLPDEGIVVWTSHSLAYRSEVYPLEITATVAAPDPARDVTPIEYPILADHLNDVEAHLLELTRLDS